jgi:hypothetical protein
MANAATNTRSDRDSASFFLLVIEKFGSFRLWVSLGLSGFVYFAESVLLPLLGGMALFAISITLVRFSRRPSKVPNKSPSPGRGLCDLPPKWNHVK